MELMSTRNYNFNAALQNTKNFKNPSIYEKFIEHYGIDEFGSSFPTVIIEFLKKKIVFLY